MADITRTADAYWQGDSRKGSGKMDTQSKALNQVPYTYAARFEGAQGTNPEELVAAAHAGCFSMAFASLLSKSGYQVESLHTHATLSMEKQDIGFTVTGMRLEVEGKVPNLEPQKFQQLAEEAEKGCPISRLLRPGLQKIEVVARLQ